MVSHPETGSDPIGSDRESGRDINLFTIDP